MAAATAGAKFGAGVRARVRKSTLQLLCQGLWLHIGCKCQRITQRRILEDPNQHVNISSKSDLTLILTNSGNLVAASIGS